MRPALPLPSGCAASTANDALHARFSGPGGEHYSCFLEVSNHGEHFCPASAALPPGLWTVNVILVRSLPNNSARRQWPRHCSLAAPRNQRAPLPLLDYILGGRADFAYFGNFTACLQYPSVEVLTTTWHSKGQDGAGSSSHCAGPLGPGVWMPLDAPGVSSPEETFIKSSNNGARGMHHAFVQFGCSARFLSKKEATQCIKDRRLVVAGDSRGMHLAGALSTWLGKSVRDSLQYIPLHQPYGLGLPHALHTHAGRALRHALAEGRTVVINSVLHDVAEFYNDTTVDDVMQYWGEWVNCSTQRCQERGQVPSTSTDHAASPQPLLARHCGCHKAQAVSVYVQSIKQLAGEVATAKLTAAAEKRPLPNVYWTSLHKRPPAAGDRVFDWQTSDVLFALEDYAAGELEKVGVGHLDLRWVLTSAPPHWWDDAVHVGKDKRSLLLHGAVQTMLQAVCQ